jgi:exopolysaccharide production protein ExoQ
MEISVIEHIFTIISLIFFTGGPMPVILAGGVSQGLETSKPDYMILRVCFQLIYVITLFYLARYWRRAVYLLLKDKLIVLMIGIVFLSSLWSIDPDRTIIRGTATLGTTLFGIYFATRYSLRQQLYLLGWVFGLIGLMSIVFAVGLPKYGVMQGIHMGAWRGIYDHKNGLGPMMVLSVITFAVLAAADQKRMWWFRGQMLLSIGLLLLSKSSSPVICLVLLAAVYGVVKVFILKLFQWEYRLEVLAVSLFVVLSGTLGTWFVNQSETIANIFGKDLTFTGRTQLWSLGWDLVLQKPWLGYGYEALWSGHDSETAVIWRVLIWEAPNSHNSFLEIWLGLGLVGLSILLAHSALNLVRVVTLIYQTRIVDYFLVLMVMLFVLFSSSTEAFMLSRNSVYWVLYVSSTLSLQLKPRSDAVVVA